MQIYHELCSLRNVGSKRGARGAVNHGQERRELRVGPFSVPGHLSVWSVYLSAPFGLFHLASLAKFPGLGFVLIAPR